MEDAAGRPGQRIDRWLWCARFSKSRSVAAALIQSGRLRVNGERISKASRNVRPGDVLTFPLGTHIRVIEIVLLGLRRGPASEAAALYRDLEPPPEPGAARTTAELATGRSPGMGRPTKKERRQTDALKKNE
ncbi:MAG: RNA-binding S4 domain-containing protein [Parvibaculum sp.]|uniref:RNA-binding S4 domain-containing protein n=1 Tax=Parvibaculum sp. TaxID=2024848 RepID=UPI0027223AAF|nr:RNA-binding S4 domain-containing protein [Parvibaculum sp.]MDO8840663.1 RNA-binding S4 domain-containing protein [Parvibaculum sp.]